MVRRPITIYRDSTRRRDDVQEAVLGAPAGSSARPCAPRLAAVPGARFRLEPQRRRTGHCSTRPDTRSACSRWRRTIPGGPMTDWAEVYRANVDAVTALAGGTVLGAARHAACPATPEWTVREVLAHLAGSPADALSGRMDGAPGPGVDRAPRRRAGGAHHRGAGRRDPGRGRRRRRESRRQRSPGPGVERRRPPRRPARGPRPGRAARAHVATGGGGHRARIARRDADAFADVSDYELFRAFFSRRSRAQIAAWGTGLDQATLDGFSIFGPRRRRPAGARS